MTIPYFPIVCIASATALSLLGDAALYAVLPSQYANIGLTPLQVGILLSVNRWVRLVSNHLAERCYLSLPVRLLLAMAFFLASLVTATYGYFRIFVILFVARVLWGICFSFIRQAGIMTVVGVSSDIHLGKWMGLYRGICLIGSLFGMLLGGLGFDFFGLTFTLIAFSLFSLFSVPLSLLSQRGIHHIQPPHFKVSIGKTSLKIMLCGFAVGIVGFGLIMSTLGLIVKKQIGMSMTLFDHTIGVASITGIVLAIRWGIGIVGSPVLGAIADRTGRERSVPVLFIVGSMALGLASFPFGLFWMISGVVIVFLCGSLLGTLISALAGQQGAKAVSSYATAFDFGSALGPLIGWGIVQFGLPINLIFITGAVFYILGAFVANR